MDLEHHFEESSRKVFVELITEADEYFIPFDLKNKTIEEIL